MEGSTWQPITLGDGGDGEREIEISLKFAPDPRITLEIFEPYYGGCLTKHWLRRYEVEVLRDGLTAALEELNANQEGSS